MEEQGDEEGVEEARKALEETDISPGDKIEVLVGEDEAVEASRAKLEEHSQFFRALFSFKGSDGGDSVDLSCDVDPAALKWILRIIEGESVDDISCFSDAFEVLRGSAYLQCRLSESAASDFLSSRLVPNNCFRVAAEARESGCAELYGAAERFIMDRLTTHRFRPKSLREDILEVDEHKFRVTLEREIFDNEMAFFALTGWASHQPEKRGSLLEDLLRTITLELVPDFSAADGCCDIEKHFPGAKDKVAEVMARYRSLSLQERISYWGSKEPPKWPKMQVVSSTGYFEKLVSCRLSPGARWQRLTAKPERLLSRSSGSRMVAVGSVLYFLGGDGNDAMWTYDVTVDKWKALSATQTCRISPAVAAMGERIFVFGGSTNYGGLDSAECFDTRSKTWTMLTPMGCCRTGAQALTLGGKIFLFGGLEKRRHLTSVEVYDPETDQYEQVADIPRVISEFGVCSTASSSEGLGSAFLVGGLDPVTLSPVNDVLRLDLGAKRWESMPPLRAARRGCAAFYDGVHLHACGGWDESAFSNSGGGGGGGKSKKAPCERFNYETDRWEAIPFGLPATLHTSVMAAAVDVPVRLMENFRDLGASNCRVRKSSSEAAAKGMQRSQRRSLEKTGQQQQTPSSVEALIGLLDQ